LQNRNLADQSRKNWNYLPLQPISHRLHNFSNDPVGISVASQTAKFLPQHQAVTNKVEGGKNKRKALQDN